jgi:hypothetical protein
MKNFRGFFYFALKTLQCGTTSIFSNLTTVSIMLVVLKI